MIWTKKKRTQRHPWWSKLEQYLSTCQIKHSTKGKSRSSVNDSEFSSTTFPCQYDIRQFHIDSTEARDNFNFGWANVCSESELMEHEQTVLRRRTMRNQWKWLECVTVFVVSLNLPDFESFPSFLPHSALSRLWNLVRSLVNHAYQNEDQAHLLDAGFIRRLSTHPAQFTTMQGITQV